jgi:hypothetical protein
MTTVSLVGSLCVLSFATVRPTFEFTSFSLALTTILPSLTVAAKDHSESSPGESSMSPVRMLKQAGEVRIDPRKQEVTCLRARDRRCAHRERGHPLEVCQIGSC